MTSTESAGRLADGFFDISSTIRAVHSEPHHIVQTHPHPHFARTCSCTGPARHPSPTHTSSSSEHIEWSRTGQARSCCSANKVMMLIRNLAREPSTIHDGWRARPDPVSLLLSSSLPLLLPSQTLTKDCPTVNMDGWMAVVLHTVMAAVLLCCCHASQSVSHSAARMRLSLWPPRLTPFAAITAFPERTRARGLLTSPSPPPTSRCLAEDQIPFNLITYCTSISPSLSEIAA